MERNTSGIIQRIDDLGRIVIPPDIRRHLKVREGDAFEISIADIDGKEAILIAPYSPFDERLRAQFSTVLEALGRQISQENTIYILDNSGIIAGANHDGTRRIFDAGLNEESKSIIQELQGKKWNPKYSGCREMDGKTVKYYPIISTNELVAALAIVGKTVYDKEAAFIKTVSSVISAMLG